MRGPRWAQGSANCPVYPLRSVLSLLPDEYTSLLKNRYTPIHIPAPGGARPPGDADDEAKWYFAGPQVRAAQGWKLYISATRPLFLETLAIVGPILERHATPFKYVASDRVLRKLNAGLYGYSQIGKVIVAYFDEDAAVAPLIADLVLSLEPMRHKAPLPPFAAPIGGGLPLSYRYGAFAGDKLHLDGEEFDDDRASDPAWIEPYRRDPFAPFLEARVTHAEFDALLRRFPVYEVLNQGGKGGVYAAFDLEEASFCDLILKIGYRNGQILPDGRDGMDLLAHEHVFFGKLRASGIADVAPAFHAFFGFPERSVLAMQRVEGHNLMRSKQEGSLAVAHLEAVMALMERIHAAGLYLGDPKLANFVADATGRVYAIDFESAGELVNAHFDLLRTFHFSHPDFEEVPALERAHFLYSALHRETKATFSEGDRIIDLIRFVENFVPDGEIEAWAFEKLQSELRARDLIQASSEPSAPEARAGDHAHSWRNH